MIDPLLARIISLGFALLFLIAAAHKLSNRKVFRASFDAYEIVPKKFSALVASVIPPLELLLGVGWLAAGLFAIRLDVVTLVSLMLLASYALAIGINLRRGRNYIDCGCSFSGRNASAAESGSQQISAGLLYRNCMLVVAAAVCFLPSSARSLQIIDIFALVLALVSLVLLYGTFNQVLTNRNIIRSWRHTNA